MRKDTTPGPESILNSFQKPADDADPLNMDPEEYRDQLKEFELTPEQEVELLQILWNIMATMVDLGWGLDYIQITEALRAGSNAVNQEDCGQQVAVTGKEGKGKHDGN